jgi:anti-sigma-K factor RskA
VLEPHEREAVELRLAMDPELRRRVAWWEERLRPLAEAVPALEPSPQVWRQIEATVARTAVTAPALRRRPARQPGLWQSLALWRSWAAGASLTAAALAAWIFLAPPQPRLIAVLGAPDQPPSWLLTAAVTGEELRAQPVGPVEPGPRVHELWLLPPGGTPLSLGVLATDGTTRRAVPEPAAALLVPGASVAVSLEPAGGSPTGQPTGPVLYTGRLIADPQG